MPILFLSHEDDSAAWPREILSVDPDIDLCFPGDTIDPEGIEYAIVGRTRPGDLQCYPNLKAILSMWAGVEHLLSDMTVPADVPIVRMVEPSLTRGMVEFVSCHALNILLRVDEYPVKGWQHPQKVRPRFAPDLSVGIMGVGVLGQACAKTLRTLGFRVNGWSRMPRTIEGVKGFSGREALESFLENSDIVVLLLPNTGETRNIINRDTLALFRRGSALINAGRGELIDDEALMEAINKGHISRAILDVFRSEPLPPDHPFWDCPQVTVTPHLASVTNPKTAAPVLISNLKKLQQGTSVWPLVDRKRGY